MALAVGQFSFNGLIFGVDTKWEVVSFDGLRRPDPKQVIDSKADSDGAWDQERNLQERHLILNGFCRSTPDEVFTDMLNVFEVAFALRDDPASFAFNFPRIGINHFMAKPGPLDWPVEWYFYMRGLARWRVELIAGDPTMYSGEG